MSQVLRRWPLAEILSVCGALGKPFSSSINLLLSYGREVCPASRLSMNIQRTTSIMRVDIAPSFTATGQINSGGMSSS